MNDQALVHVVEDDESMRTALTRFLRAAGYNVVAYSSAVDFQSRRQRGQTECALLDVQLPGVSGIELQWALATSHDPTPVVFLTAHGDIHMSVEAMKSGAIDFLTKPPDQGAVLQAVERALAESRRLREERAWRDKLRARYATLKPRERQVFAHVITGQLNKQIAADLGTAERTVKAHRHNLMAKMQANSVADLVRMAQTLEIPTQ